MGFIGNHGHHVVETKKEYTIENDDNNKRMKKDDNVRVVSKVSLGLEMG